MKLHIAPIALAAALTAATGAFANNIDPQSKISRSFSPLKEEATAHLEQNAPEGGADKVPHFGIFGKSGKFYLGIGGAVKVTAGLDLGAPTDNPNEFVTSDLATPQPGCGSKFNLSAMQTNLFVNFVALPGEKNQIGAFILMNLLSGYRPVVQSAYIRYRGITAGYDYSVFSDNGAVPPTIDYEGPSASTAIPVATISYRHSFGKRKAWTVMAGIDMPYLYSTNSYHTASVTQSVPNIAAAMRFSWNENADNWIKLAAIMRNMFYRNETLGKNRDITGWGISLSGTAEIFPGLRSYWQGVCGRGIASLMQDLYGVDVDLTPSADGLRLRPAMSWGAIGGLQYDFSRSVYCSAAYSHVRTYNDPWRPALTAPDATPWAEQYKYAQYAVGNIFWNINPIMTAGLEYIYGRRVNFDCTQAHTSRIQGLFQVSF